MVVSEVLLFPQSSASEVDARKDFQRLTSEGMSKDPCERHVGLLYIEAGIIKSASLSSITKEQQFGGSMIRTNRLSPAVLATW